MDTGVLGAAGVSYALLLIATTAWMLLETASTRVQLAIRCGGSRQ
jgi:hypothetical protein